ncbi:hypothetical protein I316_01813 [Kwoniella heveanensis BCC8398]|uniref:Uncharacterized protein n=1 Tax=Kwoniella heveanensis BCC8398 TaxID=1296120 RepID=A0A1B9GZW6_9TREE|nr:hypothetical protein I316_01813 [Kwoniella heveanensis BCC8398]
MPRSNPPSTISILLPPPSTSYTTTTTVPSGPGPGPNPATTLKPAVSTRNIIPPLPVPTLEVLLLAKKIASERGQKFDLESYLNPEQLEEYRVKHLGLPPKPAIKPPTPTPAPEVKEEETPAPVLTTPATPSASAPASAENTSSGVPLGAPGTPDAVGTPISTAATATSTPVRRVLKIPDLSHLHWKQRAKRLAEIAREQEMIDNGEIPEPSPLEELAAANAAAAAAGGKKGEVRLTEKDREAIRGSASYWNSLLISARKARGPQWDYSTQALLYDKSSSNYYTQGKEPPDVPVHIPKPKPKTTQTNGDVAQHNDATGEVGNQTAGQDGEVEGAEAGKGEDLSAKRALEDGPEEDGLGNKSPMKRRRLSLRDDANTGRQSQHLTQEQEQEDDESENGDEDGEDDVDEGARRQLNGHGHGDDTSAEEKAERKKRTKKETDESAATGPDTAISTGVGSEGAVVGGASATEAVEGEKPPMSEYEKMREKIRQRSIANKTNSQNASGQSRGPKSSSNSNSTSNSVQKQYQTPTSTQAQAQSNLGLGNPGSIGSIGSSSALGGRPSLPNSQSSSTISASPMPHNNNTPMSSNPAQALNNPMSSLMSGGGTGMNPNFLASLQQLQASGQINPAQLAMLSQQQQQNHNHAQSAQQGGQGPQGQGHMGGFNPSQLTGAGSGAGGGFNPAQFNMAMVNRNAGQQQQPGQAGMGMPMPGMAGMGGMNFNLNPAQMGLMGLNPAQLNSLQAAQNQAFAAGVNGSGNNSNNNNFGSPSIAGMGMGMNAQQFLSAMGGGNNPAGMAGGGGAGGISQHGLAQQLGLLSQYGMGGGVSNGSQPGQSQASGGGGGAGAGQGQEQGQGQGQGQGPMLSSGSSWDFNS